MPDPHLELVREADIVRGQPRRWGFWYRLAEVLLLPVLLLTTRHKWRGAGHIPASGPAILAANHLSYAEPATMAHYVAFAAGRLPRFLIKQGMMETFFPGKILQHCGMIPVLRATADASRSLDAAAESLKAGEVVAIYPEGTITRDPDLWPMKGRTGAARLALTTGVPVIPIATWGAEKVFGYDKSHELRKRHVVTTIAGPPVNLSRWQGAEPTHEVLEAATAEIMRAITALLADLRGEPAPAVLHDVSELKQQQG